MKRTTLIAGVAGTVLVLGGGVALAYDSEDRPTDKVTHLTASPSGSPSDDPSGSPSKSPSTSPSPSKAPTGRTAIDRAEAVRIALRAVPGGRIESVERETEHGRAVWDVDVIAGGMEHDLDIDSQTGTILRHRTDDNGGRDDRGGDDRGGDDRGGDDRGGHDDQGYDDHGRDHDHD